MDCHSASCDQIPRILNAPTIAMTAHAMQGDRERCLAAGMDDCVTEPIHVADRRRALDVIAAAASRGRSRQSALRSRQGQGSRHGL